MWQGSVFLIIQSKDFDILEVKQALERTDAKVIVKYEHENKVNFIEDVSTTGEKSPNTHKSGLISHIITNTIEFIEYELAKSAMIPITTEQWVFDSIKANRLVNPNLYNPDPRLFLKDCFVCVADNLPAGDKEVIYGAVRAFGGSYLDALTKYTTHLIAVDVTNEKSIIAYSAISSGDDPEHKLDIKIVFPDWIDQCLTLGKRVDETPYLVSNTGALAEKHESSPDLNLLISHEDLPSNTQFSSTFLQNKSFYIAPDYNTSERLNNSIIKLIKNHGGTVLTLFDSAKVDIYIGKYRSGDSYVQSCKSNRIIVGNINWLYAIIVTEKWVLPINSSLLHYPLPPQPLSKFKDLNISVTNYSGDARTYLSKLITTLGGNFTKTMTKENHYLIAAKAEGKKYETAKYKWLDENGEPKIKVINHLWLEECFSKWDLLDTNNSKFEFLGNDNQGVEVLLGRTKLDDNVIKQWFETEQSSQNKLEGHNIGMSENEAQSSKMVASEQKTEEKKEKQEKEENTVEKQTAPEPVRYGGRSAAKKAALKLHDNMSDLNQYQEMTKSSRKMKTYMETLEAAALKERKRSSSQEEEKPAKKKKASQEEAKKQKKLKEHSFDVVAIITGCELEITLSKSDLSKLAEIGVKVLTEFLTKFSINTLIAPKILRTEKFLRSLSKVKRIIHPNYLVEVLKRLNSTSDPSSVLVEFNIDDYSIDKYLSTKEINEELGIKSKGVDGLKQLIGSANHGKLFLDLSINLSSNINGGVEVISRILQDHGLKLIQEINSTMTAAALKKSLLTSKNEKVILVAHPTKDTKLVKTFNKLVGTNAIDGIIIEWDWCVKSIFKMKMEPFDDYIIKQ